jgi:hypothetical protein
LPSALIVTLLLNRSVIERGFWRSVVWGCWSFWYLAELFNDARHAWAPPSLWEDITQLVHVTGLNPNAVGLPLAGILVISMSLYWRIQSRLHPQCSIRSLLRIFGAYPPHA